MSGSASLTESSGAELGSTQTWYSRLVYLLDGLLLVAAAYRLPPLVPWSPDLVPALATLDGLLFGVAGTIAVRRQPHNPIGPLLVCAGLAVYAEDLYWVWGWSPWQLLMVISTPVFLHLTLAYPWGRLGALWARGLVIGAYLWAVVAPVLWMSCLTSGAADRCRGWEVVFQGGNVLVTLLIGAVLLRRTLTSTPQMRRLFTPLLTVTLLAMLPAIMLTLPIATAEARDGIRIVYYLVLLGVPLAFLTGVVRAPRAVSVLTSLAEELRHAESPADVEALLQGLLGDESLRVGLWDAEKRVFRGVDGSRLEPTGTQAFETTDHAGHRVALLRRAESWAEPKVQAVGIRLAAIALAHYQAAEDERSRLRRDLHDSAQQILVATAIKLRIAEDRVASGADLAAHELADLRADIETSLSQLRRISHGEPAAPGPDLAAALTAIADRTPAVRLVNDAPAGLDAEAVQAAYFVVAEAVTNAQRHGAADDIAVTVTPWTEDTWRVTIVDNGRGAAAVELGKPGGGLEGLQARLSRIGGSLEVRSAGVGHGVFVDAVLPRVGA